ncbi:MAG TPA: phenylalanine--tRNA ligase subunit beta [Geobacteraceae bacterium]|nr:phenylalanine--tRNA ligase subunit beta [Geobacteraceae bacterium]
MIVTYNWLKEFVEFDLSPADLADLLTMLGLEVEGMATRGEGLDSVVVALVEEKTQHPNADKLSFCKVNNGREILDVVCGAQNFKAGDKVALAQIGTVLPGDFRIKRSKIRGVESCGMLCSEKELGLSEESAGIMVLPPESALGVPLFDALGMKDTVFEIGLTPNRADCLSVIGIAREIAAKLGIHVKYPGHAVVEQGAEISTVAAVIVEDPQLCPRYTARYIAGCKIAQSPGWLAERLKAVGLRPINNVVDVTNYVLMEYGHPLHAFDFARLAEGKIIVRRAAEGERFTTLDGQERILTHADLTIRDGEKAVALAGIMGGENSEIAPGTTDILLESAYFNPSSTRLTSKRLGLHTDASHRFERGADIEILVRALDRAASLMADLAGGTVARGILDVYPRKFTSRRIRARADNINRILGLRLAPEEIGRILRNLEFSVDTVEPGIFEVGVPSFRVDIEREIDLAEEVARLNGFENIPATMPKARVFSDLPPSHQCLERQLRGLMAASGFSEVINFSFIAPESFDRLLLDSGDRRRTTVRLRNPLVEEQSVMRTTLLPSLLETAAKNISVREMNQRIFELRRVYLPEEGKKLPAEPLCLAGLLTGRREAEGWNQEKYPVDFFDAKGIIEDILDAFHIDNVSFSADMPENFYHPGKACRIFLGEEIAGSFGELHPDVLERFGIGQAVLYFEINFEILASHNGGIVSVAPPSRYPDSVRDIAMLVGEDVAYTTVRDCVTGLNIREVENVEIFDLYKGEHVPPGLKSVAIRVRYRSGERTLTDEEVTRFHERIIKRLINELKVSIR